MIFLFFKKIGVSWYWCYYPHRSRDALFPVCGIFQNLIPIFQIKFLFLVKRFQKNIALVYFLKTDWSYMFLKAWNENKSFNLRKKDWESLKCDFKGHILCPLRTLWRNLHLFQDILKFSIKNRRESLGKRFCQFGLRNSHKNKLCPYRPTKIMNVFMIFSF